ncbi:MAG: DUF402 domain-containing protein [Armatimonadota bacterium]|nr:DUF402 domain-containing protein [Armatimonadota bacterium]
MSGPEAVEIKRSLDGAEHRFRCTLLARGTGWAALRYVTATPVMVGSLLLPAGTETVGYFWADRPYTAYHWMDRDGRTLGVYLNAAADVEIGAEEVRWLDLALDVLVTREGGVEVLDDDEARAAPVWVQPRIEQARRLLLTQAPAIAADVRALSEQVLAAAADRRKSP